MIETLQELLAKGHEKALRPVFIRHPGFTSFSYSTACHLFMVTGTPEAWGKMVDEAFDERVSVSQKNRSSTTTLLGIPLRPLESYRADPDWPIILEAIVRLKLIDISAVFRQK